MWHLVHNVKQISSTRVGLVNSIYIPKLSKKSPFQTAPDLSPTLRKARLASHASTCSMTLPLEKIPCEHIHVYVMDTHHCVSYKPCSNQVSGCVCAQKMSRFPHRVSFCLSLRRFLFHRLHSFPTVHNCSGGSKHYIPRVPWTRVKSHAHVCRHSSRPHLRGHHHSLLRAAHPL